MFFKSDNAGPMPPQLTNALIAANEGYASPYGADDFTTQAIDRLREVFEAPEAAIYLVPTGTAANSLILACLAQPWDQIFCSPMAHIINDECTAVEYTTGGARLTPVEARQGKINPGVLTDMLRAEPSVHNAQHGPLSLSNVTELGTVYSVGETKALTKITRAHGMKTHLDGARFANAVVSQDCSAADLSWRAGIDTLSFGGTKNGLPGVEAAIFFDPELAASFEFRRKRAGHLLSKGRYLGAQLLASLKGDLWLDLARRANANAARLSAGISQTPGARLLQQCEANMMFVEWPRALHARLHEAGARYYLDGDLDGDPAEPLSARLVCDWQADEGVTAFLDALGKAQ